MRNDVFAGARIAHSVIRRNLGNGVSTRGTYFQLFNCTLEANTAAGFEYNPSYTSYEALQVCDVCLFINAFVTGQQHYHQDLFDLL